MKRFFKNLKAMALVAVVGVVAVSCAEAYDDTELKQQVADLAERVTNLEERLDNEVTALRALIDEKVALAEVQEDGAWKFTLADGKTLTLYPEYVENGLTVVTEDGVQYWAKVDGNVTTIITDAAGNKVAFHNAPELRVNAEGIIEVSVDGGKSWVATQAPSLFAAIDVKENHACLTLQNGEVLKFALYEQVAFNIVGNTLYVEPMSSAKAVLELTNMKDLIVLSAPKGWTVEFSGNIMNVTAPMEEPDFDADGDGEKDSYDTWLEHNFDITGEIVVLGISEEGKSIVARLNVAATSSVLWLTTYAETLNVVNRANIEVETMWGDVMSYPTAVVVGMFPEGEYTVEDIAGFTQMDMMTGQANWGAFKYETIRVGEGETYTKDMAEAMALCLGEDFKLERGKKLTVFAVPDMKAKETDVVLGSYAAKYINAEVVGSTFKDITISVAAEGYDYYKLVTLDNSYITMSYPTVKDYVEFQLYGMFHMLESAGYDDIWGVNMSDDYEGSFFLDKPAYDINSALQKQDYPLEINANNIYTLYVLPMEAGRPLNTYEYDDFVVLTCKTKGFTAGGMLLPTIEEFVERKTYSGAYGTIKAAEGTYRIMAKYYTDEDLAKFANNNGLLAEDVANSGQWVSADSSLTINTENQYGPLAAGKSINLVAICVDANGKYGEPVQHKFTTKEFVYSAETVKLTDWVVKEPDDMVSSNSGNFSFKVEKSANVEKLYYEVISSASYTRPYVKYQKDVEYMLSDIAQLAEKGSTLKKDISSFCDENGVYTPKGVQAYKEYLFIIVGVDKDGKATKADYKFFHTFGNFDVIKNTDAKWAATKPQVTIGEELISTFSYGEYYQGVELPKETAEYPMLATKKVTIKAAEGIKVYVRFMDDQIASAEKDEKTLMSRIQLAMNNGIELTTVAELEDNQNSVYWVTGEQTFNMAAFSTHINNYFYYIWQDAEGNWYEDEFVKVHTGYVPEGLPESDGGIAL